MKDPAIKPYYLDKFVSGFIYPKVVKLVTCGYFPQEEQPEIVLKSMINFLADKENSIHNI